jgi:hypothetical protein
MLERQTLLLCPWGPSPAPPGRRERPILDSLTGETLGFTRALERARGWLRWLAAPALEVCEVEDASLLCTLHGPRWPRRTWEIRDADERTVALFDGSSLLEPHGHLLAVLRASPAGDTAAFSSSGLELATLVRSARGIVLTFQPAVEGEPFTRMALLGAALACGG